MAGLVLSLPTMRRKPRLRLRYAPPGPPAIRHGKGTRSSTGSLTPPGGLSEVTTAHAAEFDRLRADATRERDELRELLDDRARMPTEARDEQRQRAERAEHELGQARGELAQLRAGTRKDVAQESGAAAGGETPQRRRRGGSKEAGQ